MVEANGGDRDTAPVRRRARWLLAGGAAIGFGLLVAIWLSWHFSSEVLVPDHSPWSERVEIEEVGRSTIVLERSAAAMHPGSYGLVWQAGHAVVGPVIEAASDTVTRRLSAVHGYLVPGLEAGLESAVKSGTPREALGLPYEEVAVAGELGRMPAWLVAADRRTWAIFVHGHNGSRQNGLQFTPVLHRAGMPTLLISYRNDLGAPESPDGLHHLGLTEWRDVEAAARYALRRGARRIVLVGHSMGGAIVGQFMRRSPLARHVDALVLDAPVLDWRSTLDFNTSEEGFPTLAALPMRWAISARIDVDWDALDLLRHHGELELPILLSHGTDDPVVPIADSEELARVLPQWVTYYAVPGAGHVRSWNVKPRLYERRVRRFLAEALQEPAERNRARPRGSGSRGE